MKTYRLLSLALVFALASSALAVQSYIETISYRQLTVVTANTPAEIGMWEYVYDVQGNGGNHLNSVTLHEFDASLIVNQNAGGALQQKWDWVAANNRGPYGGSNGSISYDGLTWTVADPVYEIDNTWHVPADYWGFQSFYAYPGFYTAGSISETGVSFQAKMSAGNALDGLILTFRIVHPNAPGNVSWYTHSFSDSGSGTIIGPGTPVTRVGDFDGDGDIDADDIDSLGAAIQAGSTDLLFDMDGNGLIEQADFDLHVTTLVDTLIGEGSGTMFGDFNLDGLIDLIDLGTIGEQYGVGTGWATGDADGNGLVDLIDLGSVGENYGFTATAPIPEPACVTLLGLGAVALVRRRKA